MHATPVLARRATVRDLMFFRNPSRWPLRPFLPVVRRRAGQDDPELGLLFDARAADLFGYSSTVFLINFFEVPAQPEAMLALPKLVYDTFDELADAGWTVD